jgi:anti-sigma-K factor RskA
VECPAKARESTQVLIDYCAGMLEAEVAAALEGHIKQCDACREFCRAQARVWSALEAWEPEPISQGFDERLLENIEAGDRASLRQRIWHAAASFRWRPVLPLAAAAIVIVAVLLMRTPSGTNTPVAVKNADVVDVDQVEKALDDIDMLKQLYAAPPTETAGAKQL